VGSWPDFERGWCRIVSVSSPTYSLTSSLLEVGGSTLYYADFKRRFSFVFWGIPFRRPPSHRPTLRSVLAVLRAQPRPWSGSSGVLT